jgi:Aspartyl protease
MKVLQTAIGSLWPGPGKPLCFTLATAAVVLVLLLSGCQLTSMARFAYENARAVHSWTGPARHTSVAFTLVDNHILLPVRINGGEPMNFVLDSGAGATVILESRQTRSLGLKSSGEITVSGVGSGPDPTAHIVRDITLELGSLRVEQQPVIYLPLASVPFFQTLDDVYFDGVIGASFFTRFQVAIDYDRQLLTFTEPSGEEVVPEEGEGWHALPLEIVGGVPYLTAQVANDLGAPVEVKLLADTGARGTVSLTPTTHDELPPPREYFPSMGQGLSGDVPAQVSLSRSFVLGPYQFATLPVSYEIAGGESENDSNGLLGNEILSRFNIVFDYPNTQMLLRPNERFADPIPLDRSGLQLRPHLRGAIVRRIAMDSGAANSSLELGDIITSFNAVAVTSSTIGDLKRSLASDLQSVQLCWQAGGTPGQTRCENVQLKDRMRTYSEG